MRNNNYFHMCLCMFHYNCCHSFHYTRYIPQYKNCYIPLSSRCNSRSHNHSHNSQSIHLNKPHRNYICTN